MIESPDIIQDSNIGLEVQRATEQGLGMPLHGLEGWQSAKRTTGIVGVVLFTSDPQRVAVILTTGDMLLVRPFTREEEISGVYISIDHETPSSSFSVDRDPSLKQAFKRTLTWGRVIGDNSTPEIAEEITRILREALAAKQKSVQAFKELAAGI